jgi:RNA polymerase sigma-70 factor (ECF subfamily)
MAEKFERIYHRHLTAVLRFATSLVGRKDLAEDITSDAFVALLRNLDAIDEAQLPGWLLTVARNRARDYWRKQATELHYLESLPRRSEAGTDAGPGQRGLLDDPSLKPVHRICLTLRYVEGMTRREIAEFLGLSEMQVKGHVQYALQLLRKSADGSRTS